MVEIDRAHAMSNPFTRRRRDLALTFVALALAVPDPGCKRKPRATGTVTDPLSGTFEGRPFEARGSIAWTSAIGGSLSLKIYDRPAVCGTPSDTPRAPSENFISIYVPWWRSATAGKSVPLSGGAVAPDEASVSAAAGGPTGGEVGTPFQGHLDVVAISATGGTLALDVENDDSAFRGRIPFVICQRAVAP